MKSCLVVAITAAGLSSLKVLQAMRRVVPDQKLESCKVKPSRKSWNSTNVSFFNRDELNAEQSLTLHSEKIGYGFHSQSE
jgi:hypothetical protein